MVGVVLIFVAVRTKIAGTLSSADSNPFNFVQFLARIKC
jgi:hypothetical protein